MATRPFVSLFHSFASTQRSDAVLLEKPLQRHLLHNLHHSASEMVKREPTRVLEAGHRQGKTVGTAAVIYMTKLLESRQFRMAVLCSRGFGGFVEGKRQPGAVLLFCH